MPGDENEGAVSMGIEVEGLTKRHRDKGRRDGLGAGDAGHGARPARVAFVHTQPIGALTIGGEEMTCSQSTRST